MVSMLLVVLSWFQIVGDASIIIVECMVLRDGVLATKNNGFLTLEIEGDSKIVIDCCNKKC